MEYMFELKDSFIVEMDELQNIEEEMGQAIVEHLAMNNEIVEHRFFEAVEIRDENIIRLTAEFDKDKFNDLSQEEIRDTIFEDIEKFANNISLSFIERDANNTLNEISLGQ